VSDALVVNASPLIFLGNAGRLDLLRATGASRIIVPQAVFDEATATQHDDRAARAIVQAEWIERIAPIDLPSAITEWDLSWENPRSLPLLSGSRELGPSSMILQADDARLLSDLR
jgi:hypothetical protein